MRKLSAKKRLLDDAPKTAINVAVGDVSAAHNRVKRALMIARNGCSASRGTGAQLPWNAHSAATKHPLLSWSGPLGFLPPAPAL